MNETEKKKVTSAKTRVTNQMSKIKNDGPGYVEFVLGQDDEGDDITVNVTVPDIEFLGIVDVELQFGIEIKSNEISERCMRDYINTMIKMIKPDDRDIYFKFVRDNRLGFSDQLDLLVDASREVAEKLTPLEQ